MIRAVQSQRPPFFFLQNIVIISMISLLATLTLAFQVMAFTANNSESTAPDLDTFLQLIFSSKDNCADGAQVGTLSIDVSNWTTAICETTCRDPHVSAYNETGVRSIRVAKPANSSHEYNCFVWKGDCSQERPLRTVTSKPGDCLNLELTSDSRIRCNGRSDSAVCPRD